MGFLTIAFAWKMNYRPHYNQSDKFAEIHAHQLTIIHLSLLKIKNLTKKLQPGFKEVDKLFQLITAISTNASAKRLYSALKRIHRVLAFEEV